MQKYESIALVCVRIVQVSLVATLAYTCAHQETDARTLRGNKAEVWQYYAQQVCKGCNAEVRTAVFRAAQKYKVSPMLLEQIIRVESSYKLAAYNKRTKDYGLMQINEYNVRQYKLNKTRLLNNAYYNINYGAKILAGIQAKYGHESMWVCRYNVGYGKLKGTRAKKCLQYFKKLNVARKDMLV